MSEAKTILIVDDDLDILEQYSLLLKADGHTVVQASSLAEAEETILTVRPDLAILDLMMDEKDAGFVLCNSSSVCIRPCRSSSYPTRSAWASCRRTGLRECSAT